MCSLAEAVENIIHLITFLLVIFVAGIFSTEVKSRGNFRPVRFKAPIGGASQYQAIAPIYSAPDPTLEGVSDF